MKTIECWCLTEEFPCHACRYDHKWEHGAWCTNCFGAGEIEVKESEMDQKLGTQGYVQPVDSAEAAREAFVGSSGGVAEVAVLELRIAALEQAAASQLVRRRTNIVRSAKGETRWSEFTIDAQGLTQEEHIAEIESFEAKLNALYATEDDSR